MINLLDIHLFGKFREFAKNSKPTDDSTIQLEYIPNETLAGLLHRIGINDNEIGDVFLNFKVVEIDVIIPFDESRISIFPEGMYLLCGGQHLKGHGFIQKKTKRTKKYW